MLIQFISVLLFSGSAWAQTGTTAVGSTTLVSFSNYFHSSTKQSENEYTVFAGKTATACTSSSTTVPCDSCATLAGTPIASIPVANLICNQREVYAGLIFAVTLRSTNPAAYSNCPDRAIMMRPTGGTGTPIFPVAGSQTAYPVGGVNTAVTVNFTWSQIWNAMGDTTGTGPASLDPISLDFGFNSSCGNSTFVDVGLRLNVRYRYVTGGLGFMTFPCSDTLAPGPYEGICSFSAFRGDEKVFFENISVPKDPSNPDALLYVADSTGAGVTRDKSNMVYDKLRIFCKPGNGAPFTVTTNDVCADLQIDGRTLNDAKVGGLQNNVQYEFLAANVDQAGNVTYFTDDGQVGTLGVATPEAVNGLLDGKSCFIATAAFGSTMAPEVERFRQFRDGVLMKHSWGRAFVEFYYKHSPRAAKFIGDNEILRTLTRWLLYPILGLAELILKFGILIPLFFSILMFGAFRRLFRETGFKREKI